jgi:hypothetical protein
VVVFENEVVVVMTAETIVVVVVVVVVDAMMVTTIVMVVVVVVTVLFFSLKGAFVQVTIDFDKGRMEVGVEVEGAVAVALAGSLCELLHLTVGDPIEVVVAAVAVRNMIAASFVFVVERTDWAYAANWKENAVLVRGRVRFLISVQFAIHVAERPTPVLRTFVASVRAKNRHVLSRGPTPWGVCRHRECAALWYQTSSHDLRRSVGCHLPLFRVCFVCFVIYCHPVHDYYRCCCLHCHFYYRLLRLCDFVWLCFF